MTGKNILILFGGTSPEHDVSIAGANAVLGAMNGHTVIPVYITRTGKWLLYDGKLDNVGNIDWEKFGTPVVLSPDRVNRGLLRIVGGKVKTIPVDVVFPVLHGQNGEDGTIQGLCELAGIPYVGCSVAASAVAMDKPLAKHIARSLKIPTADSLDFAIDEILADTKATMNAIGKKLKYPCFVKPAAAGSSVGVTKVHKRKELLPALLEAASHSRRVIVEKAVVGREIEVAVLGCGTTARASAPGEIIPDGEFYDFDAKYTKPDSKVIAPAELDCAVADKVREYALAIYRAVGGSGLARVDFFVDGNKVVFNEMNTVPGFTKISMFAKLWKAEGMPWPQLVDELIASAQVHNYA
jgi:D-alanine-D-alanine ligase